MGHSLIIRHLCPPPTVVSVCSPNQPPSQSGTTDCLYISAFNSVSFCCDSLARVWEEIHVHLKTMWLWFLGRPLPYVWIQLQKYIKYPPKSLWIHSLLSLLRAISLAPCAHVLMFPNLGRDLDESDVSLWTYLFSLTYQIFLATYARSDLCSR